MQVFCCFDVPCLEELLLNFYISSMWLTLKTIRKIDKSYEIQSHKMYFPAVFLNTNIIFPSISFHKTVNPWLFEKWLYSV